MKSYLVYCMFFLGALSAKCQSEKKDVKAPLDEQDRIFKNWLIDTLATIKKNPANIEKGLIKSQLIVAKDSLTFEVMKTYECSSKQKASSVEILNVLSLLEEYKELPANNYFLSFITEVTFYSSMSTNLKYDFISEIKNLKISTSDIDIEYNYIRGRLAGKKVKPKSSATNQKAILYDFDWKDNKLIKKKVE